MAKCPKCGEKIKCLKIWFREHREYTFDREGKYTPTGSEPIDGMNDETNFQCPHCEETLTENPQEATEILNKPDDWKIA